MPEVHVVDSPAQPVLLSVVTSFTRLAFALLIVSVGACVSQLYATRHGIGLGGDSFEYIVAARNIIAGRGIQVFDDQGALVGLNVFPPGYPLILSLSGFFHADPIAGAGWIQAVLFAITTALCGGIGYATTRSIVAAVLAAAWCAATLLEAFAVVKSEGAFIVLLLIGLCALAAHLHRTN